MPIVNIQTDFAGQVNVNPRIIRIDSTDTYAQITTAGYLSGSQMEGFAFSESDIFAISFGEPTPITQFFVPNFIGNIITLSPITLGVMVNAGTGAQSAGNAGNANCPNVLVWQINGAPAYIPVFLSNEGSE